jgi:hypothetical protein
MSVSISHKKTKKNTSVKKVSTTVPQQLITKENTPRIFFLDELNTELKTLILTEDNISMYQEKNRYINSEDFMRDLIAEIEKTTLPTQSLTNKKDKYDKIIQKLGVLIMNYVVSHSGKLAKPMHYDFTCSYVNLEDIYFSQDTVKMKLTDYTYINDIICDTLKTPIKIVFDDENNIYFTGYWGLEEMKEFPDEIYHYSNYIPMIEVIDNHYVYTTINNRRLVTIYLLLYSLIENKHAKFKYLSNFLTYDIIEDVKAYFGINNIYIPVVIYDSKKCAPHYLMAYSLLSPPSYLVKEDMTECYKNICRDGDSTKCKWENFLKYRYSNQRSWQWTSEPDNEFIYGSPFIPYTNRVSTGKKVLPDVFSIPERPLPHPKLVFHSKSEKDYHKLLKRLFGDTFQDKYASSKTNICIPPVSEGECHSKEVNNTYMSLSRMNAKKNAKKRKINLRRMISDAVLSPDTPIRPHLTKTARFSVWNLKSSSSPRSSTRKRSK